MNKRSITLALIVILLLLIIAGGSTMNVRLANTQRLDISEGEIIEISYTSEPITIYPSDNDQLVLKEYMNSDNNRYFASINQNSNVTRIRRGDRPFLSFIQCDVEIYLPKKYLDSLIVSNVSGRIRCETDVEASSVRISTTSGSITTENITADNIYIKSTSGGLRLAGVTGSHRIETTSGGIRLGKADGTGRVKTTSGGITAAYTSLYGDVEISSTSGGIHMSVPSGSAFDIKAKSTSGGIKARLDGPLQSGGHSVAGSINGGGHLVYLHTVSGGITMETN